MFSRSRLSLAATAAGLVTVLLGSAASAAAMPGASGVGDPYYPNAGNGGYDVSHYDIRLTYDPATDLLSGTTTILARTTQELSSFDLDFLLPVKSVLVNNSVAQTTAANGELVVTPPASLGKDKDITVVVQYAAKPSTVKDAAGRTNWRKTADGALAVDQPDIAQWWFPSNNHPADKATFDVAIQVPKGVEVISNGVFRGNQQSLNGWVWWSWRSVKPQVPYLTALVIGQYDIRTSTAPNGQPVVNAYDVGNPVGLAETGTPKAITQINLTHQLLANHHTS
jgi:aminopeptidase N